MEDPNLLKSVIEGGPTMIPYLVLVTLFVAALVLEVLKKPILPRLTFFYFIFPLALVILALLRVILAFHAHFTTMSQVGTIDVMEYATAGLVFTRSALVLIWSAIISFVVALVLSVIRVRSLK